MKPSSEATKLRALLMGGASVKAVKSFIKKNPTSINGSESSHPMLHVLISFHMVDEARTLITACPETLQIPTSKGNYPIHTVIGVMPQLLGDPGPDAFYNDEFAEEEDEFQSYDKFTPLVEMFLEKDPDTLVKQDAKGNTALHLICKSRDGVLSIEKLQWIIHHCPPRALKIANDDGDLPLHAAASNYMVGAKHLKLLIDNYPDALVAKNAAGNYPIHLAAALPVGDASRLGLILDKNPETASQVNDEGCLPLHLVCNKDRFNGNAVAVLMEAYPRALKISHPNDGSLATNVAASSKSCKADLLARMEELFAEQKD